MTSLCTGRSIKGRGRGRGQWHNCLPSPTPHPLPSPSAVSTGNRWALSSLHLVESCHCTWPYEPLLPSRNIVLDVCSSMVPRVPQFSVSLSGSFSSLLIISVVPPESPAFSPFSLWMVPFGPVALPPPLSGRVPTPLHQPTPPLHSRPTSPTLSLPVPWNAPERGATHPGCPEPNSSLCQQARPMQSLSAGNGKPSSWPPWPDPARAALHPSTQHPSPQFPSLRPHTALAQNSIAVGPNPSESLPWAPLSPSVP